MSDDYTTTGDLLVDQTMFDGSIYYALRPELHFDMFADVKSTNTAPSRGTSVKFQQFSDLSVASTAINESTDIDAVGLSDAQVTLTLQEHGNAVLPSWRVRASSFVNLDEAASDIIGFNAGVSLDTIARDVMKVGTGVRYGGDATSRDTVEPEDIIDAADVRRAHVDLQNGNAATFGGYYAAVIHPDVAYDLRSETGSGAWRTPHEYHAGAEIWNGEIGEFEGFRFMQTNRAPVFTDAGSSTTNTDTYRTLFFGRQAIAKAFSTYEGRGPLPKVIIGPVVDKLRRFRSIGWHWYGAYGIFRQAALRAVETSSSIGTN